MRITLHLETLDRVNPAAYAILWLDDTSFKWSREAHLGLALPAWGTLRTDAGNTLICGPFDTQPLCVLEGLALGKQGGSFDRETGRAHLYPRDEANAKSGHWHVQCVDCEHIEPEFGIFADEPSGSKRYA